MKNLRVNLALLILIFTFSSCASGTKFSTSEIVPAARGTVKVKNDNNKNNVIKIKLYYLAEPERLQPSRKYYVVWMETEDDYTKNIGQIKSSEDFLTKSLTAKFKTVSSFKPAKIYLTAEDDANIQSPSKKIIISTEYFKK